MSQVPDAWCLISFLRSSTTRHKLLWRSNTNSFRINMKFPFNFQFVSTSWIFMGSVTPRRISEDSDVSENRRLQTNPNHLISLSLIFHFPCHVFRNYVYFNRFSALKRSGKIDKFKVRGVRASEIHIQVPERNFKHERVDGWRVKTY